MTWSWTLKNRTHDLPNTGKAHYPLSYENAWRARSYNFVHMFFPCPTFVSCWPLPLRVSPSLFIYQAHDDSDSSDSSSMLDACHMNSVKGPCSPCFLLAQWRERAPGVREVMGAFPVGIQIFFIPRSCHINQFTFTFLTFHKWSSSLVLHNSWEAFQTMISTVKDINFPFLTISEKYYSKLCIDFHV